MKLFAFLNQDRILLRFLQEGSGSLDEDLRQLSAAPIELRKARLELEQLSLVKCNPAEDRISLHRLVQTIIRDNMLAAKLSAYAKVVINLCDSTFPDPTPRTIDVRDRCRPCRGQMTAAISLIYSLCCHRNFGYASMKRQSITEGRGGGPM